MQARTQTRKIKMAAFRWKLDYQVRCSEKKLWWQCVSCCVVGCMTDCLCVSAWDGLLYMRMCVCLSVCVCSDICLSGCERSCRRRSAVHKDLQGTYDRHFSTVTDM